MPAPRFSQPLRNVNGSAHGDVYMHPFKVVTGNALVTVMPGRVYGLKGDKIFQMVVPTLDGIALGNPFLGETVPTDTLQEQFLWLKVFLSSQELYEVQVVYLAEASAVDTLTERYIKLAKTYTSGLVEQFLQSDVFITVNPADWAQVTQASVTGATTGTVNISAGCVMVCEAGTLDGTDPVPSKILTRLNVAGTFKPELVSGLAVAHGNKVWMKLEYEAITYGVNIVALYQCINATYVVANSVTDDDVYGHVLLAEIIIADSVMTIVPHYPGVVTAPTLVLPSDISTADAQQPWWTTVKTGEGEVEIIRAAFSYVNYDWYYAYNAQLQQDFVENIFWNITGDTYDASGLVDGTRLSADATPNLIIGASPSKPLVDGDYLWVEVQIIIRDGPSVQTQETDDGDGVHTHFLNFCRFAAGSPIIGYGPDYNNVNYDDPGHTQAILRWPFAQYFDTGVVQLHTGIIQYQETMVYQENSP